VVDWRAFIVHCDEKGRPATQGALRLNAQSVKASAARPRSVQVSSAERIVRSLAHPTVSMRWTMAISGNNGTLLAVPGPCAGMRRRVASNAESAAPGAERHRESVAGLIVNRDLARTSALEHCVRTALKWTAAVLAGW
jgi:hypothetical protein